MSDIQVATPSSNSGSSPRDRPSPGDALSPNNERSALTVAAKESLKIKRAYLFAQKHHTDLLRGMNLQEQRYMTTSSHIHCQLDLLTNLCPASLPIGCISSGNIPLQPPEPGAADHESGTHQVSDSINFPKQELRATLVLLLQPSILPNNIPVMKESRLIVSTFRNQVLYVAGVYIFVKSALTESCPQNKLKTRPTQMMRTLGNRGREQRLSTILHSAYRKILRVTTSAPSRLETSHSRRAR